MSENNLYVQYAECIQNKNLRIHKQSIAYLVRTLVTNYKVPSSSLALCNFGQYNGKRVFFFFFFAIIGYEY